MFYKIFRTGKRAGTIQGFPIVHGEWCKQLKYGYKIDLRKYLLQGAAEPSGSDPGISVTDRTMVQLTTQGEGINGNSAYNMRGGCSVPIQYLGIAADEPERLARLDGVTKLSPLESIGWTEQDCMRWCRENDLVSPIYTTASRGGCWFCHNQSVDQLRLLRKNYPDLWALLLKWDNDSPVSFHSDGRTVHDFEKRFMLEDLRKIPIGKPFRWKMLDDHEDESVFTVPKIEL